ncbi:hypothetical protein [Peptostreptococcus porci]|uniref:hypothetical protein n=2 Tax=Peptostreptococcus porci TaxID=2652282 RepID=UPI0023EF622F|nr:hypothetical protein [Peptostreptococcus porci]MDD7183550.1 hypothetical protein [Peptostreptococcus porci]
MTRKERKSNESRLSNNIKRTATTVIITAAVVGSIGITNSVRAEEKDVNITSSNSVDTTTMSGGSTSVGESSSVSTSPISTNSITVSSLSRNKEESPKPEALTSNTGSESNSATTGNSSSDDIHINGLSFDSNKPLNNGGVSLGTDGKVDNLEPMNNNGTDDDKSRHRIDETTEKNRLIDEALKKLDELKDLSKDKKDAVKTLIEGDKSGKIDSNKLKENIDSLLKKAEEQNEEAKKKKNSENMPAEDKTEIESPKVTPNDSDKTETESDKKKKMIDDALKQLEDLKNISENQKETVRILFGGDKVGKISLEDLKKNIDSAIQKARELDEKAKKDKEKADESNNNTTSENILPKEMDEITKKRFEVYRKLLKAPNRDVVHHILKDKIEGIDKNTKNKIEKLMNNKDIFTLGFGEYGDILRELLDGLSDKGGNETWEGIKKNTPKVIDNERSVPEKEKPNAEPRVEKPKVEKKPEVEKKDDKKTEPKKPKVEKKPEAKMPKENKPKIEEKKNEKPKVMAPNANKDSLKPRVIDPKSDSKEKTENKKPENNSPEMKKPEMKSPQKDDMNKKGDSNKNKMNEAPKKENNKNRMSDKMNEAPKNIKKKMLPQMGIQHSIATSLMGLSSLVGAALILFKKNDK